MANQNCNSCNDLRTNSSRFVTKGVDSTVCTSLQNDTGFSTSNNHNDCTDLDLANDCIIGNMETEVKSYSVCDWRKFMMKFIPNLHEMYAAIICAICGLWKKIGRLECEIAYLFQGTSFAFSETSDAKSYLVAGKGVTFLERKKSGHASDVTIVYIAGGLCRVAGSLVFYGKQDGSVRNFTEPNGEECYNYDNNGVNPTKSNSRKGNPYWNETGNIDTELVYEMRLLKSEYPQISSLWSGIGQEAEGGGFHIDVRVFNAGQYAFGQHGSCDTDDGTPTKSGYDNGHLVPNGYIYVQVRMSYIFTLVGNSGRSAVTPRGFLGMRTSRDAVEC